MNLPYDRRSDLFSDWLDAHVTGMSTPDHELEADPFLADLCAAADQFHGLSDRWAQETSISSRSGSSWEDIMASNTRTIALLHPMPVQNSGASRSSMRWERVNRFASGALTAAVVIVIGAGAWWATEDREFGPNPESPTTGVLGLAPTNDGPATIAQTSTVEPQNLMSSIPFPTAAECSVSMPSRDWVKSHIKASMNAPLPTTEAAQRYQWPIAAPTEEVDGILSAVRMWQACSSGPEAVRFTLETTWATKNGSLIWGIPGVTSERTLDELTDLAMMTNVDLNNALYGVVETSPSTVEPPPTSAQQPNFAPYPDNATPIDQSNSLSESYPTIFASDIEMIGPNHAQADIHWVNPETLEVQDDWAGYVVQLVRVDGVWLINVYGELQRG